MKETFSLDGIASKIFDQDPVSPRAEVMNAGTVTLAAEVTMKSLGEKYSYGENDKVPSTSSGSSPANFRINADEYELPHPSTVPFP